MSTERLAPAVTAGVVRGDAAIGRIVMRISSAYALRAFQQAIDAFGDIRAGMLVQMINAANVGGLVRTEEGRRAAGPDGTFPDEARKPISIARLADAAGLPFETTRRIVHHLVDQGVCIRVEGGVVVPRALLERPASFDAVMANVGYARKFVRELHATGLIDDAAAARAVGRQAHPDDAAFMRALAISSADYVLRFLGLLTDIYGDIRTGVIAQSIFSASKAHLDQRTGEGWRYAGIDEIPPDSVRRPVSIARLAESLGLPYETARCQVQRLVKGGVCARVEGGVIVPQSFWARPEVARAMLANVAYVRKFVHDLLALEERRTRSEQAGASSPTDWATFESRRAAY
jgi:DNA-binding Lrp family transcriptional regulator